MDCCHVLAGLSESFDVIMEATLFPLLYFSSGRIEIKETSVEVRTINPDCRLLQLICWMESFSGLCCSCQGPLHGSDIEKMLLSNPRLGSPSQIAPDRVNITYNTHTRYGRRTVRADHQWNGDNHRKSQQPLWTE